jgi:hypothetical protein
MKKITLERKNIVIDGIEKGLTIKAACSAAGISHLPLIDCKRFLQISDDEQADLYAQLRIHLNWIYNCEN